MLHRVTLNHTALLYQIRYIKERFSAYNHCTSCPVNTSMEDVYLKGRFLRGRHKNCVINPGLRDTGHVTAAAGLKHPRNAAPRPATIKLLRVTTEDQEMFNKSWKRTFAEVFTITEKASIRAFSWLKAPTGIALPHLRHYQETMP